MSAALGHSGADACICASIGVFPGLTVFESLPRGVGSRLGELTLKGTGCGTCGGMEIDSAASPVVTTSDAFGSDLMSEGTSECEDSAVYMGCTLGRIGKWLLTWASRAVLAGGETLWAVQRFQFSQNKSSSYQVPVSMSVNFHSPLELQDSQSQTDDQLLDRIGQPKKLASSNLPTSSWARAAYNEMGSHRGEAIQLERGKCISSSHTDAKATSPEPGRCKGICDASGIHSSDSAALNLLDSEHNLRLVRFPQTLSQTQRYIPLYYSRSNHARSHSRPPRASPRRHTRCVRTQRLDTVPYTPT